MRTRNATKRPKSSGFTLVEILIVVIILGILAAIVIPQFTSASTDARKSSLSTQLQSLQQQIALYQLQHNNAYPLLITTGWTVLTQYTDASGTVSATSDSTHIYGRLFPNRPDQSADRRRQCVGGCRRSRQQPRLGLQRNHGKGVRYRHRLDQLLQPDHWR